MTESTSGAAPGVTIVGAGPVGMMMALLLARQGVSSLIVERFKTRHGAPKAHALNPRSLEICKALGLDVNEMARRATPREDGGWVRFMTNLAGGEIGALPYERQDDAVKDVTPTPLINLAQPDFEDFLLERIENTPLVEIRRGLDWLSCREVDGTVVSSLRHIETGEEITIESRYLIGADGAGSAVRRDRAIDMTSVGVVQSFITIHFAANLRPLVGRSPGILYWIMQPPHTGVLIAYNIENNWCLLYPYDPALTPRESFTEEYCTSILRRVIGTDDVPLEIKHILPWMMMSEVAEHYRAGGVFLVGDAAHRFPPTGGLGLNTGLQDAHNLAWKIAAVERYGAPSALLDTYESERQAVALTNSGQSFKNAKRILGLQAALRTETNDDPSALLRRLADPVAQREIQAQIENQREHFDSLALQLGFTYGSSGGNPGNISQFTQELKVGARLPHAWLEQGEARVSSLDLLNDRAFTLFVGDETHVAEARPGMPVVIVAKDRDFHDQSGWFSGLLQLDAGQSVLVRPDGHVAAILARGGKVGPEAAVADALAMTPAPSYEGADA